MADYTPHTVYCDNKAYRIPERQLSISSAREAGGEQLAVVHKYELTRLQTVMAVSFLRNEIKEQ